MKKYTEPSLKIYNLASADVITSSGGLLFSDEGDGNTMSMEDFYTIG